MYLRNIDRIFLLVFSITFPSCQGSSLSQTAACEVGSYLGALGQTTWEDSDETLWKEHITDPDGVPIYRGSIPVDGPRRSRYLTHPLVNGSVLSINSLQYDDAGYYSFSDPTGQVGEVVVIVNGDHVCNESRPHTALVGNDITYSCRFTFYGSMVEPFVWEGPGTSSGAKFANDTRSDKSIWKYTYNGTGTTSITIRVTASLNGTRRSATQYGCPTTPYGFRFRTGVLTVMCKNGFGGTDCTRKLTCQDKPCKNKAVCTEGDGIVKCHCDEKYTGFYCTDRILCYSILCQHEGTCIDEVDGSYYCQCKTGYEGIHCENKTRTDNTKQKTSNTSPFLLLLLLLAVPLAGVILGALYMKRKMDNERRWAEEDETTQESDSD